MPELLTIDEAISLVLERAVPLPTEEVALGDAAGRVLAEAAVATVDLPPFPSSAMDGFAVRAADTPATLPVVARIPAGSPSQRALVPGEAMAISTGAVVPPGADAVVPVEEVEEAEARVSIPGTVVSGANVRQQGGDIRRGELVVAAGVRLGPVQVGSLAAGGVARIRCSRRPRVTIVVTGTELRSPGEPLRPGEIYDSNGYALAAQVESAGGVSERLPAVRDDRAATARAVARGLERDVLVTTGGVSVGVYDLVREAGAGLGVEEVFWQVAVRPGKPIAFGVRGSTLVFGLPGNPVSSLVGFELFVRPALGALQGVADPRPVRRPARLGSAVRRIPARDSLLRGRLRTADGALVLDPLVGQESHMIARAAGADALALVPRGEGELPAGSTVEYLPI